MEHRGSGNALPWVAARLARAYRLAGLLWLVTAGVAAAAGLPLAQIEINGHRVTAEVAATPDSRGTGLMYRKMLPEDRGMLFVFPEPAIYRMWMANTEIPLSVAFIGQDGTILNIHDMPPFTHSTFPSAGNALYALEVNRGWFAKRKIGPGAHVQGLQQVPEAGR
jgi:uncharacterized protein